MQREKHAAYAHEPVVQIVPGRSAQYTVVSRQLGLSFELEGGLDADTEEAREFSLRSGSAALGDVEHDGFGRPDHLRLQRRVASRRKLLRRLPHGQGELVGVSPYSQLPMVLHSASCEMSRRCRKPFDAARDQTLSTEPATVDRLPKTSRSTRQTPATYPLLPEPAVQVLRFSTSTHPPPQSLPSPSSAPPTTPPAPTRLPRR